MKNSILISHARSGTNFFLGAYKALVPDSIVLKEIFRKTGDSVGTISEILSMKHEDIINLAQNDPASLWVAICKAANQGEKSVISKIFYYHVAPENLLWQHFGDENKIIHLIRRNPFNTLVSLKLAKASNSWQSKKIEQNQNIRFTIEPSEIETFKEGLKRQIEWTRNKFESYDYVEVYYEDICESRDRCAAEIAKKICVPKVSTFRNERNIKQNRTPNSVRVENYREVQQFDIEIF